MRLGFAGGGGGGDPAFDFSIDDNEILASASGAGVEVGTLVPVNGDAPFTAAINSITPFLPILGIDFSDTEVDDGSTSGTAVCTVSEDDSLQTVTFTIAPSGDPDDMFEMNIDGVTVQLTDTVDFATDESHPLTIRGITARGQVYDEAVTIDVTPEFTGIHAWEPNGTTTRFHLLDGSSLTPGKVGTLAVSIYGRDAALSRIFSNSGYYVDLRLNSGTSPILDLRNSAGTVIGTARLPLTDSVWNNLIFSWDLGNGLFTGAKDGVSTTPTSIAITDDTIAYDQTNYTLMGAHWGGNFSSRPLGNVWFDPTTYHDLTQQSVIDLFHDGDGKPFDWGSTGEIPTGSQPPICLNKDAADVHENLGYLGDYTPVGAAPTNFSPTPSD
ncbi:MAG: hypothetical protein COB36_12335 [Alphaproteobacteria bacterium]|nr:MAG: hypothetical protein COB36_12335 [Alphaproteobacteria bacterium]